MCIPNIFKLIKLKPIFCAQKWFGWDLIKWESWVYQKNLKINIFLLIWLEMIGLEVIIPYVFQAIYLKLSRNLPFIIKETLYVWIFKNYKNENFMTLFVTFFFKKKLFFLNIFWKNWHCYSKFKKFTNIIFLIYYYD